MPCLAAQQVPYLAAIVDPTHVGSATVSFKDLVTVAQELEVFKTNNRIEYPLSNSDFK